MDHVNIISQETITMIAPWASNIIGIFGFTVIFFLMGMLIYSHVKEKRKISNETIFKIVLYTGAISLCLMLIMGAIFGIFFRVPSGRYRYEATIDEENITVAEYNEFMKAYNHSYRKDGIYHFEDWAD
jgi:vacuolar-type H+-ATPase subunit I/STV1